MMSYTYEYPRPMFTTDCVVFSVQKNGVDLLLIERGHEPFKGFWAFPGGFLDMEETATVCAARELKEEAGIDAGLLQWGCLADSPQRDPRGRVLSAVYFTFVNDQTRNSAKAGDDAAQYAWHSLLQVPPLAADHYLLLIKTLASVLAYLQLNTWQTDYPFLNLEQIQLFISNCKTLLSQKNG